MEKYTSACRFVLVCNNASKVSNFFVKRQNQENVQVIEPLRSRCICLRVPAPRDKEVEEILCNVYRKEVTRWITCFCSLLTKVAAGKEGASGRSGNEDIKHVQSKPSKSLVDAGVNVRQVWSGR